MIKFLQNFFAWFYIVNDIDLNRIRKQMKKPQKDKLFKITPRHVKEYLGYVQSRFYNFGGKLNWKTMTYKRVGKRKIFPKWYVKLLKGGLATFFKKARKKFPFEPIDMTDSKAIYDNQFKRERGLCDHRTVQTMFAGRFLEGRYICLASEQSAYIDPEYSFTFYRYFDDLGGSRYNFSMNEPLKVIRLLRSLPGNDDNAGYHLYANFNPNTEWDWLEVQNARGEKMKIPSYLFGAFDHMLPDSFTIKLFEEFEDKFMAANKTVKDFELKMKNAEENMKLAQESSDSLFEEYKRKFEKKSNDALEEQS